MVYNCVVIPAAVADVNEDDVVCYRMRCLLNDEKPGMNYVNNIISLFYC